MLSEPKVLSMPEGVIARRNIEVDSIENLDDLKKERGRRLNREKECTSFQYYNSSFFEIGLVMSGLSFAVTLCLAILT